MDGPVVLAEGDGCYPDGDETILAEGQAESWMSGDLKGEVAIAALVEQGAFWWAFHGQAANNEWPGAVDEVVLRGGVGGAGEFDCLGALALALGKAEVSGRLEALDDVAGLLHQFPARAVCRMRSKMCGGSSGIAAVVNFQNAPERARKSSA